ncbi:hypothetical protein [Streptomyces sp. NPDC002588]
MRTEDPDDLRALLGRPHIARWGEPDRARRAAKLEWRKYGAQLAELHFP